jgi:sugar/nucleoside kinase (ribokinase family)
MKKVIGLGNALVDIMTILENDEFLNQHNLPKGSMQLVDLKQSEAVNKSARKLEQKLTSGGSAANTMYSLAKLGIDTTYIGKISNDEYGNFFKKDMENSGVNTILFNSQTPSGVAMALVSKDGERTFATYLGAAVELNQDDLKPEHFEGKDIFHIEGYLVYNHPLMLKAAELAKQFGLKISLDLASYNVVEDNYEFLKDYIEKYVDIVFANEEEAKAFTGKNPEDALNEIAKITEIAVVKIGDKGSLIKTQNKKYQAGVIDVKMIDTTGAGDSYAAGFLYGLINGYSPSTCGKIGAILSGKIIEFIGAKPNEETWNEIKKIIANL